MIELEPEVLSQFRAALPYVVQADGFNEVISMAVGISGRPPSELTPDQCFGVGDIIGKNLLVRIDELTTLAEQGSHVLRSDMMDRRYEQLETFIADTRDALHNCIDELGIAPAAKQFIQASMDHAVIDFRHPKAYAHFTRITDGRIFLGLNVNDFLMQEHLMHSIIPDGLAYRKAMAYTIYIIGHELGGHGTDRMLQYRAGWDRASTDIFGDKYMGDFPWTWDPESEDDVAIMGHLSVWAKEERFADYFGLALTEGLGYAHSIMNDVARIHLTRPYATGLTMGQVRHVIDGVKWRFEFDGDAISQSEWDKRGNLLYSYMTQLYKNFAYTLLYPFSRQTVESIISEAWEAAEKPVMTEGLPEAR